MGEQLSAREQQERAEATRQIRHSTEMEGGRTDEVTRADQDRWVRGEISAAQLVDNVRSRIDAEIEAGIAEQQARTTARG